MNLRYRRYLAEVLQIRSATYRGKEGFKLFGKCPKDKSISIFVRKRETAEKIRDVYKKGGSEKEVSDLIMAED